MADDPFDWLRMHFERVREEAMRELERARGEIRAAFEHAAAEMESARDQLKSELERAREEIQAEMERVRERMDAAREGREERPVRGKATALKSKRAWVKPRSRVKVRKVPNTPKRPRRKPPGAAAAPVKPKPKPKPLVDGAEAPVE